MTQERFTRDSDHALERCQPVKVFRLQSFGGTIKTEATFNGFTIPSVLRIGNHFGTDEYLPLPAVFQVQVILANYH